MGNQSQRHAFVLGTLARCDGAEIELFAEQLLEQIENVEVLKNRTGLVMFPMRDTVHGTAFHLGEVLVSEAHIRALGFDGYGMKTGRNLSTAMAIAIIDAAWQAKLSSEKIDDFIEENAAQIAAADAARMCAVEATRVNMETF